MVDFVLGRLKFVFRGAWTASTAYVKDDVVRYGGRSYVCKVNHTSGIATGGFETALNANYWELMNDGIDFKGLWAFATYYKVNDVVKYGGRSYVCKISHTSGGSNGSFETALAANNWEMINDGIDYKGAWAFSTYYKVRDIVRYGGRSYICAISHTSGSSNGDFETALAANNWVLYNDGIDYKGSWAFTTYYKVNDVVSYGGKVYICSESHTSGASNTTFETAFAANKWQLFVDGIQYKSAWVTGTFYKVNDIVKWGADIYICTTAHTAGTNWVDTESNFALLISGLEFEDTWSNATLYQPGDVVRYGGYQFVATNESTNTLPTNTSVWSVLSTGFTVQGAYSNTTAYKPGDVATYGGYTYVAKVDTVGVNPSNSSVWDITVYGTNWNGQWTNSTSYQKGDIVRYGGSSYVSIVYNNTNNAPNTTNTTNWNLVSQGADAYSEFSANGDLIYFANNGIDRLPIGSNGQVLVVNTNGYPVWDFNGKANNVYYVSTTGVDAADAGTTMQRPFATIQYATQNVPNNSVILVRAGTYTEILPIVVPPGVSVVGDSQRTVKVQPAAGYSGAGNTMWQLSDSTLLKQMTFTGMTGFIPGGTDNDITTATIGGVFIGFNPATPITHKSPYVLECTSVSTGGVGVIVDGSVHASGNKSMLFHAYTNINDGGVGYWIKDGGRAEIVSCFTYYCHFGLATSGGGFIRGLNNNNSYGKYGAVSRGFLASEVTANAVLYGEQLQLVTGSSVGFSVGETITGQTSGATGTVTNVQTAAEKVYYYKTSVANFANNEVIVGGTSGVNATITSSGVTGQKGFVLVLNGFTSSPINYAGRSVEFATGDSNTYVIQSVSGSYVDNTSPIVFVLAQEKTSPSSNGTVVRTRESFSQIRLTGHDFLSIGTGNTVTTNYPGVPTQAAVPSQEVVEGRPGRVYYVSTDQNGNFKVGPYFKVEQATGRATLDASAFNLSGLSELRLGSIGAQLGETINEFSSDLTLSANAINKVPVQAAVKTYVDNKTANTFANSVSTITPKINTALMLSYINMQV